MAGMSEDSQRRGTGLLGRMFGASTREPRAPKTAKPEIDEALFRQCPGCGESVFHIAPRCRHCGKRL